ncbi:50S ribosomal protein L4 [Poriferisphaera corsica]|uniref:Large ribosomal subunit protein uL4 n=1 Tax=Poriferisphaera corsica TaxID=2528020 RepID=A0A517YT09_9BACT|nr:50S ribosomal protein L4 [Poriferisphaera corsica]QDU33375.1 50S ribosomal protein L4 [Poriferisphaera corsica]
MIQIPVHNISGEQVGSVDIDEAILGGEVRDVLLKQAYVRYHANRRLGIARTKNRADTAYSTRKLYKQKGTGNARRGSAGTNIMRHGGQAFAKRPKSWRQKMPTKMRRLANRNAILAKAVDSEIKLVEGLNFDKPSTSQFNSLLAALKINRTCLVALADTRSNEARSAKNLENVDTIQVDHLNVFDLLNHRYLLADKDAFEAFIAKVSAQAKANEEAA